MDQKAREILDRILKREPAALTKPDIAFLKARRDYLSEKDLEKYAEILKPKAKP